MINESKYGQTWKIWPSPPGLSLYNPFKCILLQFLHWPMTQYIQYPFSRLQKYLSDAFDIDFKYLSFRFSFPVYLSMLCMQK